MCILPNNKTERSDMVESARKKSRHFFFRANTTERVGRRESEGNSDA
jgi:hypothetical protein